LYDEFVRLSLLTRLSIFLSVLGLVSVIILTQSSQDLRQQAQMNNSGTGQQIATSDFKRNVIKDRPSQILEVTLHNLPTAIPPLSILDTKIKEGFIPEFRPRGELVYELLLLDENATILSTTPFEVVKHIDAIPPLPGQPHQELPIISEQEIVVNIPWDKKGHQLVVKNPAKEIVTSYQLSTVSVVPHTGEYVTAQTSAIELESFISRLLGPDSAPPVNYLDLVFISSGYTTQAEFEQYRQQVTNMSNYLLTFAPFSANSHQIRFSSIENLDDLGCIQMDRLIVCNTAKVLQTINTVGAPFDRVIVVHNSPTYGGSGGSIAVTYRGEYQNPVFVHELAHTLAGLEDEYIKQTENDHPSAFVRVNCYRGVPPNPQWGGVVNSSDYHLGCNYPSWYRSSQTSIMRDITAEFFNPVSQHALQNAIDFYTQPLEPTPYPSATATPISTQLCDADINLDNKVDLIDYSLLVTSFKKNPPPTARADINHDGKVDLIDYSYLVQSFATTCP
jgi:hypothetical protein